MKISDGESFVNPIDVDKITDIPGLIRYPHHIGSPAFSPTEAGTLRNSALRAMQQQSDMQLLQIKQQIELLARQAEQLMQRIEVSKAVYSAEMNFQPVIGNHYHLYARETDAFVLSMIAPDEWSSRIPYKYFVASVQLLADHTWNVTNNNTGVIEKGKI
jgi:hypothetical protein